MYLRKFILLAAGVLLGISNATAIPKSQDKTTHYEENGVHRTVFEHKATGAKLDYVTNSGICEKTPGVNQYSGYLSVGSNMNMWFWFFEARNNPTTAPIATWFNGGPGCSSMIGLFQENGPCQFYNGASTPSNNSYSFNNYANMLYVDQPIGVGFSYGNDPVDSTDSAAQYVWIFLQAFYAQFPQYKSRNFGIFTESYGGHYGPEFAYYIEQQNKGISSGSIQGTPINLIALGINNGWYDAIIQERAYIDFSVQNNWNQILTSSQATKYYNNYQNKVLPALQNCASAQTNSACSSSDNTAYQYIEGPISNAKDFDVYDVREPSNDPYPPTQYTNYLKSSAVTSAIGAKSTYSECSNAAGQGFSNTGDNSRSQLSALSSVVQSGIQVLMWAGDADWICNWVGNFDVANNVTFPSQSTFRSTALKPYMVNGKEMGQYKTMSNLSFLRVYAAGHEVPYYQPAVALQVFKQTMQQKVISST